MNRRSMAVAALVMGLAIALVSPAGVSAKGKPASESSNSLSVPTVLVGGAAFTGVTCGTPSAPSAPVYPTGEPRTGYEVDPSASWYVQKVHAWRSQCYVDSTTTAAAEWGDNLAGDAKLRVGKPIRVELGLEAANTDGLLGFAVEKLEPSKLDRESAYGTRAQQVDGAWTAVADDFASMRVYDGGATFSIRHVANGTYVVPEGTPAKGEINATGKVLYGYQLKVTTRGQYEITYTLPNVTIIGADAGTYGVHTVSLIITIV